MSGSLRSRTRTGSWAIAAVVAATGFLSLLPQAANAATVSNGDFETGTLSGWTVSNAGSGNWFAYTGTTAPISSIPEFPNQVIAPPQGTFGAISDQDNPGTHILYQDIALEPGLTHTLSMLIYYESDEPIAVPSPETLSYEVFPNQQYRVDVMKPGTPVDSVNPADILSNVFRTTPGAPQVLQPTALSVDLTPYAGQMIRLRLAEVDNQGFFNAGADAISIATPVPPPSNVFTFGKLKLNKKKGTGKLEVNVPGSGTLTAVDVRSLGTKKTASASKRAPARIKKAKLQVKTAGKAKLNLKPTGAGKKTLREKGKLAFKAQVTFTPTGGTAASQSFKGKLKLNAG